MASISDVFGGAESAIGLVGGLLGAVTSPITSLIGGGGGLFGGGEAAGGIPLGGAGAFGPLGGVGVGGQTGGVQDAFAAGGVVNLLRSLLGGALGGGGRGAISNFAGGLLSGSMISALQGLLFGEGQAPEVGIGTPQLFTLVYAVYPNGFIEQRFTERGTPFLMSRDMQRCKKVNKKISKAHAKMPRRTVKQSKADQLKEAAIDAAMQNVQCPPLGARALCS